MRLSNRAVFGALVALAGVLLCSSAVFAQTPAADCSKPIPAGPTEWMNTSYLSDTNPGGFKSLNTVTVAGDKLTIRSSFGIIWLEYVFNPKDIKSVVKGDYDDGLWPLIIDVTPFQFSNSRGDTTAPPGVTKVTVNFPEEVTDQAIAGLLALRQKAVCGK